MGFFDAFYVMSYTATTIGFGEIPYPFTYNQRMWVTISIYLTVIGWAYAIGSLLALLQDRAFRQALAMQRFTRKVARLREPFLLIAGYGRTGELLGHSFDALGRQFVVIDRTRSGSTPRPGRLPRRRARPDRRRPRPRAPRRRGTGPPSCEAVVALTDDDEANLAVVMAAALLRPDVPVIARVTSRTIAERMQAFGTPSHGQPVRPVRRPPAAGAARAGLLPAADLAGERTRRASCPMRGSPPRNGRWVVCGYGRLGRELTADLRAEGLEVTVIDPADPGDADDDDVVVGDGSDPWVLAQADLDRAVGLRGRHRQRHDEPLAGRRREAERTRGLFVAARQNRPASAPLFAAMELDALLVPTEVIAHEVYAQLSTPLLWRFVREMPAQGDAWAAALVDRLTGLCGTHLQALWKIRLTRQEAPALAGWLAAGRPGSATCCAIRRTGISPCTPSAPGPARRRHDAGPRRRLRAGARRRAAHRRSAGRAPGAGDDPGRGRRARVRHHGPPGALELGVSNT